MQIRGARLRRGTTSARRADRTGRVTIRFELTPSRELLGATAPQLQRGCPWPAARALHRSASNPRSTHNGDSSVVFAPDFIVRPPLEAGPGPSSRRSDAHCSARRACFHHRRSTTSGASATRGCVTHYRRPGSWRASFKIGAGIQNSTWSRRSPAAPFRSGILQTGVNRYIDAVMISLILQNPKARRPAVRLKQPIMISNEISRCAPTTSGGVEHAGHPHAPTGRRRRGDALIGP